jgi:hypothetical protein
VAKTDAEFFDEFVASDPQRYGLKFNRGQVPPNILTVYDAFLQRARDQLASVLCKLPDLWGVHMEFVHHPAFNAWATRYKYRRLIAINDGLLSVVLAIVHRMLADRQVFRDVGNADSGVAGLPHYPIVPSAGGLQDAISHPVFPRDPVRVRYAHYLCNTIFNFVAAHEITHVAHGHCRYMDEEFGQPIFSELGWIPDTEKGNLELQTMEMDADLNAVFVCAQHVKRMVAETEQLQYPENECFRNPLQGLRLLAVAICILGRLFASERFVGEDLTKKTHPPIVLERSGSVFVVDQAHASGEHAVISDRRLGSQSRCRGDRD